ncbi:MAG: Gfo/Idh/MocA family oxidoreductase [Treponema sp.]|jgi:predicted dehydrogenase|nr:Gfo/Idh/MocA family oxidoreductase [Treponema sp.]
MTGKRIGIVGAGKISGVYVKNLTGMFGEKVVVTAVSDLVYEKALKIHDEYNIPHEPFTDIDELINCPDVDIVLNLTQPLSHYEVSLSAVKAGKHVYNEKPLCVKREEAEEILNVAREKKVRIGAAPDTFLGAGIQTCRKVIDEGLIGRPVAAVAFMMNHGHEHWHPAPEFYYKEGGGPLFDMAPYYFTALISLLGPIARVSGSAQTNIKDRIITSRPLAGTVINVEVPTHVAGVFDFCSGAVGTIITSFDVYSHTLPCMEVYGTEGTLRVPDPNTFGGPIYVKRGMTGDWSEMPLLTPYTEDSRGLGVTEMADAIAENRPHRASGELAYHVLDVMHGIQEASLSGKYCVIKSKCSRPEPLVTYSVS